MGKAMRAVRARGWVVAKRVGSPWRLSSLSSRVIIAEKGGGVARKMRGFRLAVPREIY
jgi:hypothetical protein